ncbi:hypothetical protein A2U01_0099095, partial [Trifolium medium]|nr:hypothetical protein [Trifolium medium]
KPWQAQEALGLDFGKILCWGALLPVACSLAPSLCPAEAV